MDIDRYLARIGYQGSLEPTLETLNALQLAHLRAAPFENYSIHAGEPIVLEEGALFNKIVARRRGGFCYELNGLFSGLLKRLGFRVQLLSAGVMSRDGHFGPEYDHLTLRVDLERSWLADVGFGDSFTEPLCLEEVGDQERNGVLYRFDQEGPYRVLRKMDGDWSSQYRFTLEPREYGEYRDMCHYHQTSPDSHFTRNQVCSLLLPDGRATLSGKRLVLTRNGEKSERDLVDQTAFDAVLEQYFKMKAPTGLRIFK